MNKSLKYPETADEYGRVSLHYIVSLGNKLKHKVKLISLLSPGDATKERNKADVMI